MRSSTEHPAPEPTQTPRKILLVGAGAVGQVYARHLQRGGADVSFFVKEAYAEACRAGLTLYPLNKGRDPVRFEGFGVHTRLDEISGQTWQQVWLCVPSPALRGEWLDVLTGVIGDATVVLLTPGPDDRARLLEGVPEERLVQGLITLISYQAPLPGETLPEPGIAYWFPPLSGSPFGGPAERVAAVVTALKRGGCPASVNAKAVGQAPFATALLMPHLCALEAAGWKFDTVARGDHLRLAARGARQAMAVVAGATGVALPLARHVARPMFMRILMRSARWFIPLDVETYLGYHFTKVGDQTRLYIRRYVEQGHELGLDTSALEELAAAIGQGPRARPT